MKIEVSIVVALTVVLLYSSQRVRACQSSQFTCNNGKCIPYIYKCDGDNDCGDRSDQRCCSSSVFLCNNGVCLPQSDVCDGYNDCGDYSDEGNCDDCYSNEISCGNGDCISEEYRCDGNVNCEDLSDENDCYDNVDAGLAVGLSIGLFLTIAVIVTPIIIFIAYCKWHKRRAAVQNHVMLACGTESSDVTSPQPRDTAFTTAAPHLTPQTNDIASQVVSPADYYASLLVQVHPNQMCVYLPQQSETPAQPTGHPPTIFVNHSEARPQYYVFVNQVQAQHQGASADHEQVEAPSLTDTAEKVKVQPPVTSVVQIQPQSQDQMAQSQDQMVQSQAASTDQVKAQPLAVPTDPIQANTEAADMKRLPSYQN